MPPRVHDYVIRGAGGWGAGETESGGDTHPADLFGEERSFGAPGPQCRLLRASGDTPQGGAGFVSHHTPRRQSRACTERGERWPAPRRARGICRSGMTMREDATLATLTARKLFATLLSLKYSDRRPPPSSAAFSLRHRAAAAHHGPPHPTRDSLWRRAAEGATSEAKESAQGQRVGCP